MSAQTRPENGRPEGAGVREVLLAQGKELAASVIFQYERWCRCPFNAEEGARLRWLQKAFAAWELAAQVQCPTLDTREQFPDSRLRAYECPADLVRLRKTPSRLEAHVQSVRLARQAERQNERHEDSGFWSGMPGGI